VVIIVSEKYTAFMNPKASAHETRRKTPKRKIMIKMEPQVRRDVTV
jgi:hypothetical protein